MAVISITITRSDDEILSGIPKKVELSTNIASTIFFTTDGSDPTINSEIYIEPIFFNALTKITLKVFATNGVDESPIITEVYEVDILNNTRLSHSATTEPSEKNQQSRYPFGTNPRHPNGEYLNPADAGQTLLNPANPSFPSGFDGEGNPAGFTNEEYNTENYRLVLSPGQIIPVIIEEPTQPPGETDEFSKNFDNRAGVIFQDFRDKDPDDPIEINGQFVSLGNPDISKAGVNYYIQGYDTPPPSGSFVKQFYNQKTKTLDSYYYDSHANKWIISKSPYDIEQAWDNNLSGVRRSTKDGAGLVFEWRTFGRRYLT